MASTGRPPREDTYSLADVERLSGLAAHTIRWYEELGLIDVVPRGPDGEPLYCAANLRWLEFLNRLRGTGMSVAGMTRYVALARQGDGTMPERRALLADHRRHVLAEAEQLTATVHYLDWKIDFYLQKEAALAKDSSR
ncbi:MerR family transcriptional regulator [Streptomyces sp. NPDC091209]|uniref:MerR family transcriptional regulator n=1 Tax=Streptomyces sp. NPDC091209 TaxID=3365974 RepID=UPI00380F2C26